MFEGLHRKFTVNATASHFPEFLMLSKTDLLKMRLTYTAEFIEFFDKSFDELEKTIELRLHAMEICGNTLSQCADDKPNFYINCLTNKDLDCMTHEQVTKFCKTSM